MTDSERVLALDLVLPVVMGIARTKGVMGLVGLGSILEYLEIVMIEILIKILIAVVTIAGKAKVIIDTLIKVFVAVTITLRRPRFQRFYILLQNAFCDAK